MVLAMNLVEVLADEAETDLRDGIKVGEDFCGDLERECLGQRSDGPSWNGKSARR